MNDSEIRLRGLKIRLRRSGAGEKVLFLHGAAGAPEWLPFLQTLSGRYEVLVPDHPGFGASDDPSWIRDIHDLAMFYLDMQDELDLRDVHVIGHSLGGWVAAEMAVRNCTRIRSLCLIAPAGLRKKGLVIGDNFLWSPEERIRNLFADPALAEKAIATLGALSDEQFAAEAKNQRSAAKFGWEPRWFDPHLDTWLHRVKIPVHVVWGASDKLFPATLAEQWKQHLPASTVTVIDGSGHLPHVEKPAVVAACVQTFLRAA
jgi:pimeloyl-ACP methyl ester carboxylesterase